MAYKSLLMAKPINSSWTGEADDFELLNSSCVCVQEVPIRLKLFFFCLKDFSIQYIMIQVLLPLLLPVPPHLPSHLGSHFFCLSIENQQLSKD